MAFRCAQCGKIIKRNPESMSWYPFCSTHCAAVHGQECGYAEMNGERAKLRFESVIEKEVSR